MDSNDQPTLVPDRETTAARIRKYGSHPAHDVPMPALLREEPEFARFQAERAATRAAQEREDREWAQFNQRCAKAKAEHERAVERATETGAPFPAPYVEEVWQGRPLAPIFSPDPTIVGAINRPQIFWDEKFQGIDLHERAVLIDKRAELLDRVESRKDLKQAQAALEVAQQALDAAAAVWAPFGEAVKLLNHLGETREERVQRLKEERVAREAAATAEKAYRQVFEDNEERVEGKSTPDVPTDVIYPMGGRASRSPERRQATAPEPTRRRRTHGR